MIFVNFVVKVKNIKLELFRKSDFILDRLDKTAGGTSHE